MKNMLNWFEIPVTSMDRAIKFYSRVFGFDIQKIKVGDIEMGWFPSEEYAVSGSLVAGDWYTPSQGGVMIYFNAGDDLNNILSRVEGAGGSILVSKTHVSDDIGYMATFIDTEGNRISLHSKG